MQLVNLDESRLAGHKYKKSVYQNACYSNFIGRILLHYIY